jgi:hypothetical protein
VDTPAAKSRCFGEAGPPAGLAEDLRLVLELPLAARDQLWSALGPCLGEGMSSQTEATLDQFARRFALDAGVFGRALRGCRSLVRAAALADMSVAALVDEVRALGADLDDVASLLASGFDAARRQIRGDIIRGALFEHGCVLEGVSWRADQVLSSASGPIAFPIVLITLRYADGARRERLTVQATRERLLELRSMCDRVLAGLGPTPPG